MAKMVRVVLFLLLVTSLISCITVDAEHKLRSSSTKCDMGYHFEGGKCVLDATLENKNCKADFHLDSDGNCVADFSVRTKKCETNFHLDSKGNCVFDGNYQSHNAYDFCATLRCEIGKTKVYISGSCSCQW